MNGNQLIYYIIFQIIKTAKYNIYNPWVEIKLALRLDFFFVSADAKKNSIKFRTVNYYCRSNAKKKKKTFSNEVCDCFVKNIVLFNFEFGQV